MQAIILCGGLATRLGDTTKTVPKVLLDIAGGTLLEWQIQRCVSLQSNDCRRISYTAGQFLNRAGRFSKCP